MSSSSYNVIAEADALAFLSGKGYSCVRLDDVRKESDHGLEFSVADIAKPATWFVLAVCSFLVYRIGVTLQKLNKSAGVVYLFLLSLKSPRMVTLSVSSMTNMSPSRPLSMSLKAMICGTNMLNEIIRMAQ